MKLPRAAGWSLLALFALGLILVPFALGEGRVFELSREFLAAPANRAWLSAIVVLLLASDLFLPIPSSFVAAGAASALGPLVGALAVWVGMTVGALIGYALGRSGGRTLALRVVGAAELARAARLHERFGAAVLIVSRGVPVLAEASTVFAGAVSMRFGTFAFVAGSANAGLALAYAFFAGLGSGPLAMLVPFALGVLVPALAIALVGRLDSKRPALRSAPKDPVNGE